MRIEDRGQNMWNIRGRRIDVESREREIRAMESENSLFLRDQRREFQEVILNISEKLRTEKISLDLITNNF